MYLRCLAAGPLAVQSLAVCRSNGPRAPYAVARRLASCALLPLSRVIPPLLLFIVYPAKFYVILAVFDISLGSTRDGFTWYTATNQVEGLHKRLINWNFSPDRSLLTGGGHTDLLGIFLHFWPALLFRGPF